MTEQKGPWHQDKKTQVFPWVFFLWLASFCFVGLLLWSLFALFPDQNFSGNDGYLEIVRLIEILALVSSGLLYVQRIKVGEVIRNLSIWTALASIFLLGYTYRGEVMLTATADWRFYINGRANGKRFGLWLIPGPVI